MVVFARVALTGSFTTAAADLGMPKSTVSRKVTELEARLKARLLNRTTRKVSLTDVGRTYYDYCARIVAEIDDAERAVTNLQEIPRGILRVTTGPNVAFLAPILNDYMQRYPEVRIEVFCTGRAVDLIEERFDVAIRAGELGDSTLIARSLGKVRWFLVGAPTYLKKHGRPRSIDELQRQLGEQRAEVQALQKRLRRAVEITPDTHHEFATVAQAEGVSLSVARRLLRVMTGPRPSRAVATLGRATVEAGEKAGPLLKVLDEAVRPEIKQGTADEIFLAANPF